MINMMGILKRKNVEPYVYSVVLCERDGSARQLWFGTAYSLDEAILSARDKARENYPEEFENIDYWKPLLWQRALVREFLMETMTIDIQEKQPEQPLIVTTEKNELMTKIIKGKDIKLFKKKIKKFSLAEKQYIENKLKIK